MKESNSDKPYFALKVDNNDILEKIEETDEPKIFDSTTLADREKYYSKYLQGGEYKFLKMKNMNIIIQLKKHKLSKYILRMEI